MAFTEYTKDTKIIGALGTNPSERGLTTQEFKDKFDQFAEEFVEWFNATHLPEVDAVQQEVDEHKAETTSYVAIATRDISLTGDQDISLIASKTPKSVVIYSFINDVVCASWGFVTSVTQTSMARQANNTMVNPSDPIYLEVSAGNVARGDVALSGGKLTITWSKIGSPTGTAQIRLIANYHD